MFKFTKNDKGATLVEVLVAGMVGVIVIGGIYFFVRVSGGQTSIMAAQLKLQQESSLISELFMRSIRKSSYICVGNSTTTPTSDIDNVTEIRTFGPDSLPIDKFTIKSNVLKLNDVKYLTSYLCKFKTASKTSHFKVFQNGNHAEFYLSMYMPVQGENIYLTQIIGDVRCKNR